jgi:vacuolar-type H+-ATPase subunit F/Vma7
MYKVVVITDPESATGFRLAGSDVLEVEDSFEASRVFHLSFTKRRPE